MDSFNRTVDVLRAGISLSGPRVESARTLLVEDPGQIPSLDPLVPAIVRAAVLWSDDGSWSRLSSGCPPADLPDTITS